MKIDSIKKDLVFTASRAGLLLKKHSPEILVTVGIVGVVTSAVMASKATLKLEAVMDKHHNNMDALNEYVEDNQIDEPAAVARAKGDVYVRTGVDLVKLYGPSVSIGVASLASILSAHGIMRQRNAALVAAYTVLEKSFAAYRARVVEEYGEEKDRDYKFGLVTKEEFDKDGNFVKTETKLHGDPNVHSAYARFFDEFNVNWEKHAEKNLFFLKQQQNYWNDRLKARGHVFLNEVYDSIGIEHSQAGSIVGWIFDPDNPNVDNFIDFGIWDLHNDQARMFVNGLERSILLDFNVDGTIWDKIGDFYDKKR